MLHEKIKYKKQEIAINILEYTGRHKIWVGNAIVCLRRYKITEYEDLDMSDFKKCISLEQNNWLNLHVNLNEIEIIESIVFF
jgi:magnesium transporter